MFKMSELLKTFAVFLMLLIFMLTFVFLFAACSSHVGNPDEETELDQPEQSGTGQTGTKRPSGGGGGSSSGGGVVGTRLSPSSIEFVQSSITKTYGEHEFTNTIRPGYEGSGAVTYSSDTPGVASVDVDTGEVTIHKAGSAVITAVKAACPTHTRAEDQYSLTINKATLSVSAVNLIANVGDPAPNPYTYDFKGFMYSDTDADVSGAPVLSCAYVLGDSRGSYPINISMGTLSAENYEFDLIPGALSVGLKTQAALSISGGNITKTWGDADFALSTGSSGSGTGPVRYVVVSGGDVVSISSGTVHILKAGSATVKAQKRGDSEYNHAESSPITITVGKRDISNATITVGAQVYTGSALTPVPTVTDIVSGVEMITTADYTVSYSSNTAVGTDTAAVTITVTSTGNYTGGSKTANFTISPIVITSAAITVTAPVIGAAPSSTASGTGNFTVGAVSWSPSDNPFQDGTAYTGSVTLTAAANYTFTGGLSTATINSKTAAIDSNNGSTATLSYEFPAPIPLTITIVSGPTYSSPDYSDGKKYLTPIDTVTFNVEVSGFEDSGDASSINLSYGTFPTGLTASVSRGTYNTVTDVQPLTLTVSFSSNVSNAVNDPVTGSQTITVTGLSGVPYKYSYSGGSKTAVTANIKDGLSDTDPILLDNTNINRFNSTLTTSANGNRLSRHYKLIENITSSGSWGSIGGIFTTQQFIGSLDGDKHYISNITVNEGTYDYAGMFDYIGAAGVIKNLGLVGGSVTGLRYIGGLAGYNNGTIQNCYTVNKNVNSSTAPGSYSGLGGLVGYNGPNGEIENCYTASDVGTNRSTYIVDVGGLVGSNYGTIKNCYTTGDVTLNAAVGGVVGYNYAGGLVENCYAVGTVEASSTSAGGVAGRNDSGGSGIVKNCVALNPQIKGTGYWTSYIGRVSGNANVLSPPGFVNNYARSDMKNSSGTVPSLTIGLNTLHGTNTTVASWHTASWWTTASNWNTAAWDTNIWDIQNGKLPILKNMPATPAGLEQNPVVVILP